MHEAVVVVIMMVDDEACEAITRCSGLKNKTAAFANCIPSSESEISAKVE